MFVGCSFKNINSTLFCDDWMSDENDFMNEEEANDYFINETFELGGHSFSIKIAKSAYKLSALASCVTAIASVLVI